MAAGLPDLVDCARLGGDGAVLERVYALRDLPRLRDLLAHSEGVVRVKFAFAAIGAGRAGATVTVDARPQLVCQRCLRGFAFAVNGGSDIEFAGIDALQPATAQRELYRMDQGAVSLRDLAEEELLLALPIAAACSTPESCANAPRLDAGSGEMRRPFSALQDLLKKTQS